MKKIPVKITICIISLFFILALTTCKSTDSAPAFSEPRVFLRSVDLARISFTGVELTCRVSVENLNRFEIPFPEITWDFFVNDFEFTNGVIRNNSRINPRTTTTVSIPVRVGYIEMLDALISSIGKRSFDYKVVFSARMALAEYGNRTWNFERTGNAPILQVPDISFRNIEVKNIGLTRIDFELYLEVENSNYMDLTVNNLNYNFAVNNSRWSSGTVTNPPRLIAEGKTVVPIAFSINSLNIIMDITQILNRNNEVPYSFAGDFSFGVNLPGLKDLGTSVNFGGNTRLRR